MHYTDFMEGMKILSKYVKVGEDYLCPEHDQFYFGGIKKPNKEDQKRLHTLGWTEDEDADGVWIADM